MRSLSLLDKLDPDHDVVIRFPLHRQSLRIVVYEREDSLKLLLWQEIVTRRTLHSRPLLHTAKLLSLNLAHLQLALLVEILQKGNVFLYVDEYWLGFSVVLAQ